MVASISVVMPCHNGADTLPRTLEALRQLEMPNCPVEFILVDNASSDATAQLLHDFAGNLGPIAKVTQEPKPGRSCALNRGIGEMTGELLVIVDDDILPDSGWLLAVDRAARAEPDTAVFGGQIRPQWDIPPPDWLLHLTKKGRSFGCTPLGMAAGPCGPEAIKGGNCVFRTAALGSRRFDEGANNYQPGAKAAAGDETYLVRQLIADGAKARFVPDARVRHIIQPHEMTMRTVIERYRRIGRGGGAIDRVSPLNAPRLGGEIAILGAAAGIAWALGLKKTGAVNITRTASRLGKLEFAFSRSHRRS